MLEHLYVQKGYLGLAMPHTKKSKPHEYHLVQFTGTSRSCGTSSTALFYISVLRYLVFFIRTVQQLQGQCRYVTKIYCAMSLKNLRHCCEPDRSKIQCILLLLDAPLLKGVWKINFMPDLKHPNAWVNSLPGIINIHSLILLRTGSESQFLSRQKVLGLVERSVQAESVELSSLSVICQVTLEMLHSSSQCQTHFTVNVTCLNL